MPNTNSLQRSQLGIPANESQLIAKAVKSEADKIFFDLEDSLVPSEKTAARSELIAAVKNHDWSGMGLDYRINGTDTRWWHEDIIEIIEAVGESIDTLIVPKVNDPTDIQTVATLLASVETNADAQTGAIGISAQIETAAGMNAVTEIAHASDRLEALVFGPADYAASIGASQGIDSYPGHYWQYPLSQISQAAASADLLAIGGPHAEPYDTQEFQEACQAEAALGYDGKIIVHPDQIETTNRLFSPAEAEIERAKRIVKTYESTAENDVAAIEGKIIDQEVYRMSKDILTKAESCGLI